MAVFCFSFASLFCSLCSYGTGTECWYYISVYSFTDTSFTVVAHYGSIVTLLDGIPQLGMVTFFSY